MTNGGPLRLAQRTGATALMVLFRRCGPYNYVTITPPLDLPPKGEKYTDEALIADLAKVNGFLGKFIRRYPEDWLWGHKRWKLPRA
jgi:KDO2-lipid IV(A) lauroyltransferase